MFSEHIRSVFEEYEKRRLSDEAKMQEMGPLGFKRRDKFLLPVGPEVGWFLHSLIIAHKPKNILEFGTSYGYSTLFLADAASKIGAKITSYEIADYKQEFARDMLNRAGLESVVDFKLGDAIENAKRFEHPVDFALIDIWKDLYVPCFDAIYPKLSENGIICADNMITPVMAREDARAYRAIVQSKKDVQSTLFPIGAGIEISVKWSLEHPNL